MKTLKINIISVSTFLIFLLLLAACSGQKGDQQISQAIISESADASADNGWISLFDGKTLDGWKRYNADEIGPLWTVEDGAIKCDGKGLGEGSGEFGGSLITLQSFGDFELEIEWKISEGGNSGIMYHVVEKPEYSHAYVTGPEYQVYDDFSRENIDPNKSAGANYDMFAPPADKKLNPAMEWNSSKIVYNNGKVEHWLNGEKIIEFDENSQEFKEHYEKSKWARNFPAWNSYKEGAIALQDHGAPVWFRNIRIRKL